MIDKSEEEFIYNLQLLSVLLVNYENAWELMDLENYIIKYAII